MKVWMRAATPAEQETLANKIGTTRSYLYHLSASEDKAYAREPKPKLAAAIERVSAEMHRASKGRLPKVYRTDLVSACRECEFAAKCLGPAAVRSDFPIVTEGNLQ
jgi:CRISPR/Cas system-associated exonuclease Cas4 (RecB family)